MTGFQLVFRRPGQLDRSEFRGSSTLGEPQIDGQLIVDGETHTIRGVDWIIRREDEDELPRFICTLVVEPDDLS